MKILSTALAFVLAISLVGCGGKQKPAEVQEKVEIPGKYENEHLGIKLTYDPAVLQLQDTIAESDLVILKSIGGNATMKIYKDARKSKDGKDLSLAEAFELDKVEKPGHMRGHSSLASDNYTISGRVGDILYYQKTIYKYGGMITAVLSYPDEEKETYNTMYLPLFGSFE